MKKGYGFTFDRVNEPKYTGMCTMQLTMVIMLKFDPALRVVIEPVVSG